MMRLSWIASSARRSSWLERMRCLTVLTICWLVGSLRNPLALREHWEEKLSEIYVMNIIGGQSMSYYMKNGGLMRGEKML